MGAAALLVFVSLAAYGSPIGDADRTVLAQPAPPITASPTSFCSSNATAHAAPQRLVLTNTSSSTVNFLVTASDELLIEVSGHRRGPGELFVQLLDLVFAPIGGGPPFAQGSIRSRLSRARSNCHSRWDGCRPLRHRSHHSTLGPCETASTSSAGTLSFENFWPQDTSITSASAAGRQPVLDHTLHVQRADRVRRSGVRVTRRTRRDHVGPDFGRHHDDRPVELRRRNGIRGVRSDGAGCGQPNHLRRFHVPHLPGRHPGSDPRRRSRSS